MSFSKSRTVFLVFAALSLVLGSSKNGFSFEDPPAQVSPEFDAITKDIQAAVKALEYPDQVGQDLVKMVKDWKCVEWKQKLSQAKQDFQEKKITADQTALIEEEVSKELFQTIGKEIASEEKSFQYVELDKVLKEKKADGHNLDLFPVL